MTCLGVFLRLTLILLMCLFVTNLEDEWVPQVLEKL